MRITRLAALGIMLALGCGSTQPPTRVANVRDEACRKLPACPKRPSIACPRGEVCTFVGGRMEYPIVCVGE